MKNGWTLIDKRILLILLGVIVAVIIGYHSSASDLSHGAQWVRAEVTPMSQIIQLPQALKQQASEAVLTFLKLKQ